LLVKITLGWKGLPRTNTLAYFAPALVMKKNAFYGNGTRCPTKFSDKIFDFSGFAADDVFNDWRSS
jgi:hypothetical protein